MQQFINRTTQGFRVGDYARFQSPGFVQLSVERIADRLVSVAHYGEQNGDLMADPEIVFFRDADDQWYPISYRNDYLGQNRECVEFEDGYPARVNVRQQRDLACFTAVWIRNITEQDYEAHPSPTAAGREQARLEAP
jgi:hypothetical protein